jgi:hypothetical protein
MKCEGSSNVITNEILGYGDTSVYACSKSLYLLYVCMYVLDAECRSFMDCAAPAYSSSSNIIGKAIFSYCVRKDCMYVCMYVHSLTLIIYPINVSMYVSY